MKFKSKPQNRTILAAHNCVTSHEGQHFLIKAVTLGPAILACAEPFPKGGQPIDLFGKTVLAKALRSNVENHLYRSLS